MTLSRKQLLAAGAGVALAPVMAGCAAAPRARAAGDPHFQFDEERFAAILAKPAQHRQAFAATALAKATVLNEMVASMYAYEITLAQGAGALHAVAVFYHGASIALAASDRVWNELLIPALPHLPSSWRAEFDEAGARAGRGNPYLHRRRSMAIQDDASIEALTSRGCTFFVCNNALSGTADTIAEGLHLRPADVYGRLLHGLVPAALAVPAGVMAINACQEAHFTYLQASL
ncbi:MAG TPA: hypothetical protein VMV82_05870 [Candidatus Dormibacteraeota bacterium]|nr:hypothetical protein [Candidatus Dormibacteraeota bacterium]